MQFNNFVEFVLRQPRALDRLPVAVQYLAFDQSKFLHVLRGARFFTINDYQPIWLQFRKGAPRARRRYFTGER